MTENKKDTAVEKVVLSNYLADFEPYCETTMSEEETDIVCMTSADIALALSDMIELTLADIVHEMLARGFWMGTTPDHRPCWVMARRQF